MAKIYSCLAPVSHNLVARASAYFVYDLVAVSTSSFMYLVISNKVDKPAQKISRTLQKILVFVMWVVDQ